MGWLITASTSSCRNCFSLTPQISNSRPISRFIRIATWENPNPSFKLQFYSTFSNLSLPRRARLKTEVSYQHTDTDLQDDSSSSSSSSEVDCVGSGLDIECNVSSTTTSTTSSYWEWAIVVSPFFFWGTAMVAMKEVIPKAGPFFVSSFRLIPAGFLLVAFAAWRGRPFPSGLAAWLSIAIFGLVDAACFQGFLAQGLQRTSAGLGSVSFKN